MRCLEASSYAGIVVLCWQYARRDRVCCRGLLPNARKAPESVMSPALGVPPVTVPERHVSAFRMLGQMGESDFFCLFGTVDSTSPTASTSTILDAVHERCGLSRADCESLLDAVMGLAGLGHRTLSSASEVALGVAISPQFETIEDPGELAKRLERLLNCEFIRLHSKASSIGVEHERTYASAQVLTDLRPLFNDANELPKPEGAVLSHTLSLHFVGRDGGHDNFFVVLDDSDIQALIRVLDRAIKKAYSLRQLLKESGLIYVGQED